MKTIDEMLHLELLTPEQHAEIGAWIERSSSPDEILQMPAPLWRAVERASEVMGISNDPIFLSYPYIGRRKRRLHAG